MSGARADCGKLRLRGQGTGIREIHEADAAEAPTRAEQLAVAMKSP